MELSERRSLGGKEDGGQVGMNGAPEVSGGYSRNRRLTMAGRHKNQDRDTYVIRRKRVRKGGGLIGAEGVCGREMVSG